MKLARLYWLGLGGRNVSEVTSKLAPAPLRSILRGNSPGHLCYQPSHGFASSLFRKFTGYFLKRLSKAAKVA